LGGKDKAICGLYGFIKRATQGKANIQQADKILRELILKK
jgi:Asp-tRNA(Asn)/Glu-tRNA(Gln) amidotransferase B subunit